MKRFLAFDQGLCFVLNLALLFLEKNFLDFIFPWFLFFLETFLLSRHLFRTCLALSLCHPRIVNLKFSRQYFQHCHTSGPGGLVLWPQIDGGLCYRAVLWTISCFVAACVQLIWHNFVRNDPFTAYSAQSFQYALLWFQAALVSIPTHSELLRKWASTRGRP